MEQRNASVKSLYYDLTFLSPWFAVEIFAQSSAPAMKGGVECKNKPEVSQPRGGMRHCTSQKRKPADSRETVFTEQ